MKNKKIIYVLSIVIIIFIIGFSFLIYKSEQSEKNRIQKQIELDLVYNELDSISILLGDKILTISKLGGEIDSLIIIKENIEKEKKEFRSRAFTQINRLQGKVEGYKELLIAQDEEINKLKLINEQTIDKKNVIDTLELARSKYPGSQNSLDALCKRFNIDNSRRDKHNALMDCHLLKEIYVNLLDQREPKLDLKVNGIIDSKINYQTKKNNNMLRKIIKANNNELEMHKKYLRSHLPKNYYN